jgi:hypothetical protein
LWYYGEDRFSFEQIPIFNDTGTDQGEENRNLASWMIDIKEEADRTWLVTVFENGDPHGFSEQRNDDVRNKPITAVVDSWLDEHCRRLDQQFFTGVRLSLYDLNECQDSS